MLQVSERPSLRVRPIVEEPAATPAKAIGATIPAADEASNLIDDLCRQFTQLTGRRLQFTAIQQSVEAVQERLETDPDWLWFAEIHDGARPTAFLHLGSTLEEGFKENEGSTQQQPAQCSIAQSVALAETLARLLCRLAAATTQLRSRNRDVSTLMNLNLAVPAQDDLALGLKQLLRAAVHLTSARAAAFFLLDSSTSRLKLRAHYDLAPNDVPARERDLRSHPHDLKALADGPQVIRGASAAENELLPALMRSAVCIRVQSDSVPYGTLWIYDRRVREFPQREMQFLQGISAQIAAVLERSALLRGSEMQERITRDLKAASETQPDELLHELPSDPRYELAARCTSCYELGGDLCEVIRVSEDRTAVAVGDASGNSIPAAMIMATVRGALRTCLPEASGLAEMFVKLNAALHGITRSHQFMSLCYGIYDASQRTFSYTNAGHPIPLLIRKGTVESLDSHGLLLGVIPDGSYQQSVRTLESGDVLVIYSDGISEARNRNDVLFRNDGVVAAALAAASQSARQVLEAIWNGVDQHLAGAEGGDDRTLLVLKVK